MRKLIAFGALLALAAALIGCGKKDDGASGGNNDSGLLSGVFSGFSNRGKMQAVIDDYVREVVEEAKGVRVIYTDGVFDDDIRREAKRRGIELEPVSIMASGKNNGALSLRMVVENGDDVALQLGFELWKHNGRELPPCSGVLARTGKMPEEDRQRGIDAAHCLGERILELYRKDAVSFGWGKDLKKRFLAVQWRIARLATVRAERADHAGQTELAQKDKTLADELDNNNAAIQHFCLERNLAESRLMRVITPSRRLRLQMALNQADFTQARRYAELILADDPDDTNANFAMGMSYLEQKHWTRAEEYFRRYLTKKEDAAVLNNLAIICMYTERYDEGLELAEKALKWLPDSGAVKETIAAIKRKRDEAAKDVPAHAVAAAPSGAEKPIDVYAIFGEGMTHVEKREWDQAVEKLMRCVELKPDNSLFMISLTKALFYKGRYDDALKHAQKALKLQPESVEVKDLINQIKKARANVTAKKPGSKKKPAEKKPAGKKTQKKAEKVEKPPKPAESPASADAPAEDDVESLVPVAPSALENM